MAERWIPNVGPQAAFLATTVREVLYGGAVYGGKSEAITILPLRFIHHPKHRAIILRRTRPQLQETIDRTLQLYPSISPGAKWHEAKSRWEFPTGALVQMGHAEHEKDILNFKCLAPGHEVLTHQGWKLLESIEVGEEVLTPNGFEAVLETVKVPFKGDLVVADGAIKFKATPNHRFWTAQRGKKHWREKTADQLNCSDMIQTDGPKLGSKGTAFDELMGWLISEGGGKVGNAYIICQHKPTGRADIIAACREANVSYRADKEVIIVWLDKPPHWNTSSPNFIAGTEYYPVPDFGHTAEEKFIPRTLEPTERLLRGLLLGDGCQVSENSWVYTTCSPQLANDVQELALLLGYTTRSSQRGPKHWQVSIFKAPDKSRNLPKTLTREAYNGLVYCLRVPSEYFYVRYGNGTAHVTGNTFEYNLICFDELTTFTEWQYSFMMLRNRSKSKDLPLWIRSGTNPGDIGHEWVFDRFIKGKEPYRVYNDKVEYDGKWHTIARQFIPSSVYDNAAMDPSQRDEYIAGIVSSMPAEDVAAYLGGDWNQLTGAMFKTPPVLTTAPTLLDGDYFIMRAIDFGISDPTAVLWAAFYPKQNMMDIVSELYLKDTNLDSVAFHIKAREAELKLRPVVFSVSSPEMDHRQAAAENQSINTMLGIKGVHSERANTDTMAGWAKIRELLERKAIRVWPLGDGIHGAPNLLRTLPKLQRNSGPGKNPNELRPRQDDHCADCLRYLCLAAYELPAAVQPPPVKEIDPSKQDVTFDKMVNELQKQQQRGPWVPGLGEGW